MPAVITKPYKIIQRPLPGTLARFKFNEGSGALTREEVSGVDYNRANTAIWGSDGTGTYYRPEFGGGASVPMTGVLDASTSNVTATAWVNNTWGSDVEGGWYFPWGIRGGALLLYRDGQSSDGGIYEDGGVGRKKMSGFLPNGLAHYTWVLEGSTLRFYVNGSLNITHTISNNTLTTANTISSDPTIIGQVGYATSAGVRCYDMAAYDYAMNDTQVSDLYNLGVNY